MDSINPQPGEWVIRQEGAQQVTRVPCLTITEQHLKAALQLFVEGQRANAEQGACDPEEVTAERVADVGAHRLWALLSANVGTAGQDSQKTI